MVLSVLEKTAKKFRKVKISKSEVKVPDLDLKFLQKNKKQAKAPVDTSISAIVGLLIKNSIEEAKSEAKDGKSEKEDDRFTVIKNENAPEISGGYGATSKRYGMSPHESYVDYEKLFSYLGKFRARGPYQTLDITEGREVKVFNGVLELETIQSGTRFLRYMIHQTVRKEAMETVSLVPIAGMNSGEWEQFKLWSKVESVMYQLKLRTS